MKIAMVFDGLGVGGIERVGIDYAKLLVNAGHEVDVVNLQPEKHEMASMLPEECSYRKCSFGIAFQPDLFAALLKRAWGKYVYPLAFLSSSILLYARKAFACIRHRKRYDVAIAFSGHLRDLTYVAYGLVRSRGKLAWAHGAIEDYLLLSYGFAFLYERVKNICVLSEAGQSRALECFPRLSSVLNIFHLYNPISPEPFNLDLEKQKRIEDDWNRPLVMVGRFDVDKDQATVIKAMDILRSVYRLRPHLIFVGDGPTRSICESLASDLDLTEHIHFLGMQHDVDNYFLASSVALHSSPAEGLPTVVLEAMRDGTPVLATNSQPGVPEILGDSEYGMTCKIGDPADMAKKIELLLSNENLRQEFADKGKRRVKDFSPEIIGEKLESILISLI